MYRTLFLGLIVLMVAVGRVKADEGMWLPILLKEQKFAEMRKKGLKLSAEEI